MLTQHLRKLWQIYIYFILLSRRPNFKRLWKLFFSEKVILILSASFSHTFFFNFGTPICTLWITNRVRVESCYFLIFRFFFFVCINLFVINDEFDEIFLYTIFTTVWFDCEMCSRNIDFMALGLETEIDILVRYICSSSKWLCVVINMINASHYFQINANAKSLFIFFSCCC